MGCSSEERTSDEIDLISSVLAFSGSIGSGKTTITSILSEILTAKRTSFGDYVRKKAKERQIELTRENLQKLGEDLILEEGWENFCKSVLNQVGWKPNEFLIIDGIRHMEALTFLKKIVSPMNLYHIHVTVDSEIRKKRLEEKQITRQNLTRIESHSTENQILLLKNNADLVVDGSEPINEITDLIITWVKKLLPENYDHFMRDKNTQQS